MWQYISFISLLFNNLVEPILMYCKKRKYVIRAMKLKILSRLEFTFNTILKVF